MSLGLVRTWVLIGTLSSVGPSALAQAISAAAARPQRSHRASIEGVVSISSDATISPMTGESVNGFPNWNERVLHEWINRSRSDPQADLGGCSQCPDRSCYSPSAPLAWDLNLSRAARFHSAHMAKQGFFAHDSPCTLNPAIGTLYPNSCDGSPGCACVGPGSTSFSARLQLFGVLSPGGEIIASPSDPDYAFYLWLNEPTTSGACAFSFSNGHRWLILKAAGAVGAGVFSASVADFGSAPAPTKIVSGAHYPQQASTVELWANWYDSAPPSSAAAVVDGIEMPMTLRRGSGPNGAWSASVSGVGSGTHRYYFVFRDAAGLVYTYPATGSYGICSGASCSDWSSLRGAAQWLRGDVNGDGSITAGDVFYLSNFLFAAGSSPIGGADANSDGAVTAGDIFYLINFLFAGGPPPAP